MYIYIDIRGGRTCDVRCPGLLRVCRNLEGNRVSVPLRKWSDSLTHRTKGFLFWHAVENATPRVVNARLSIYTPGSSLCVEKRQGERERERGQWKLWTPSHHHYPSHYVPLRPCSLLVSACQSDLTFILCCLSHKKNISNIPEIRWSFCYTEFRDGCLNRNPVLLLLYLITR